MEAAASVKAAVSTAAILRNFSNMTRLPQSICYLAANPHLDCSLRIETSNKAQARISSRVAGNISRYGKCGTVMTPIWHPHKRPIVHQRWGCPRGPASRRCLCVTRRGCGSEEVIIHAYAQHVEREIGRDGSREDSAALRKTEVEILDLGRPVRTKTKWSEAEFNAGPDRPAEMHAAIRQPRARDRVDAVG